MFWWTEVSASCSNLSAAATYEHADSASSCTRLQLIGGVEHRENRASTVQIPPKLTILEDPGGWSRITWGSTPGNTSNDTAHHQILQQTLGAITQPGASICHLSAGDTPWSAASTRHLCC
jgi:hypothetical protein